MTTRRKTRKPEPRRETPAIPRDKGGGARRYEEMLEARAAEGSERHKTLLQWRTEGRA